MTAEIALAGASFHNPVDWHAIDWKKVHRNVRRLQARIVKAIQAGRWGKAKALQRLLTHSFSGKALAVKRVTENQGNRTAGVDGDRWNTPAQKEQAVQSLRQHGYQAQPLRRVYIPKGDGTKKRGLGIPTMKDRAMQALYKLALDPVAETLGDPNSYGFRLGRSTADAIGQCFLNLRQRTSAEWILDADIQACFDAISHEWLLAHIPMDKPILAQWLKAGFIHQETFHPTEAGAPQGGICSPVLANLTLDGLEKQLAEHFPKTSKIHLVRFADDFVVTGKDKHLLETEVKPLIEQFLRERGLSLSPKKTTITHIDDGFDFLGQNIRKYEGTLRITPARKSVNAILTKVRQIIKANPQATAGYLIGQLNPVIRGWVNYHRHVVSKKTFSALDHQIFQALWRWAKRRHRNQSNQWIKAKYFPPGGGRKWRFSGPLPDSQGTLQTVHLFLASSVPIKRHIKVRAKANPYDPQWEPYFERRLETKMRDTLQPNRVARHLWLEQAGRCPVCHQFITTETGWEKHHLLWRAYGGLNTLDNLVLLHPNCHKQVHSQRLTVQKPRPSPGV